MKSELSHKCVGTSLVPMRYYRVMSINDQTYSLKDQIDQKRVAYRMYQEERTAGTL